ncbi:unnamed protein product [Dimorphilus gyrociliatus]|uniref:Uncharacterized protein n=1 Tax=Dimorphilus gyrociliatus TaxID=2664684 RepID=A0A7I8VGP1_9ANNE|nr:unnamed protein product [Dimorphilus gyrociliatus]
MGERLLGGDLAVATLLTTISWIVYAAEVGEGRKFVHACFGLAIVSSILSLISSIVAFTSPAMKQKISKKRTQSAQQIPYQPNNRGVIMFPHNFQQQYIDNSKMPQSRHIETPVYGHPYKPYQLSQQYDNYAMDSNQA